MGEIKIERKVLKCIRLEKTALFFYSKVLYLPRPADAGGCNCNESKLRWCSQLVQGSRSQSSTVRGGVLQTSVGGLSLAGKSCKFSPPNAEHILVSTEVVRLMLPEYLAAELF